MGEGQKCLPYQRLNKVQCPRSIYQGNMWKQLLPFFIYLITSSPRPFTIFRGQPIFPTNGRRDFLCENPPTGAPVPAPTVRYSKKRTTLFRAVVEKLSNEPDLSQKDIIFVSK